ncbi:uncharacterized protein KIAA0040 homolog [Megalops cyprinoides]|uniref:uncharacterized protein KIAA0040 homolog n=1 Tax=Megalops cyprinoides TaxID=118141 RepID=UPI001865564A|nr:uncharacterized protein KIAA0040 homolog [Megalops cyprinoides]
MREEVLSFFKDLWSVAVDRHNQGIYNTVCLVVLLALPLVVLFTSLVVCCHCCCCRKGSCCGCCRRGDHASDSKTKADKKKKKNKSPKNEDLWISVKPGPMTPDRMALTMV